MNMQRLSWTPLDARDLAGAIALAESAFPSHFEDPACFEERLERAPEWCFVLRDQNGDVRGYLIAYPWPLGLIPPLNALLGSVAIDSPSLFLHDLALAPDLGGQGLASEAVEMLVGVAEDRGITSIALVAVNDTIGFWKRRRFAPESAANGDDLSKYGPCAGYMVRRL